jgi:hypothetical protein
VALGPLQLEDPGLEVRVVDGLDLQLEEPGPFLAGEHCPPRVVALGVLDAREPGSSRAESISLGSSLERVLTRSVSRGSVPVGTGGAIALWLSSYGTTLNMPRGRHDPHAEGPPPTSLTKTRM